MIVFRRFRRFRRSLLRQLHQHLIRLEIAFRQTGNSPNRVAQRRNIHVMLYRIRGNEDIPNAQFGVNCPRTACIDDIIHTEMVNQHLCADSRIHLADAADDQHNAVAAIFPHMEIQPDDIFCRHNLDFLF